MQENSNCYDVGTIGFLGIIKKPAPSMTRQWWLGDWWNACKWGDGKSACDEIGVDYQDARICGHVSSTFQLLRRHNNLTFSHHREVCPIDDPAMQDKMLDWCLAGEKRKTVRELRDKVQAYLAMKGVVNKDDMKGVWFGDNFNQI